MDKPKVLIVDDEQFFVDLISDLLAPYYQIVTAQGGQEALKCAQVKPLPDLILLDVMLPDIHGYEVCKALKLDHELAEIPVIFLTIKSDVADQIRGFDLGAVDYISKPVSPPIVKARVGTHIALKQARENLKRDLDSQSAVLKASEMQVGVQQQQLAQSNSRPRNLSARLDRVREEECKKIARDAHDDLEQMLRTLKIDIEWLKDNMDNPGKELIARAVSMAAALDRAEERVRDLSYSLRPSRLDDLGLGAAIDQMVKDYGNRSGLAMRLDREGLANKMSLNDETQATVFWIVQDSLTRVIRHSEADRADIHCHANDSELTVTIADNGKGFSKNILEGHRAIGLLGMHERAEAIGGDLTVAPGEETGTLVTLRVPLSEQRKKNGD